MDFVFDRTAEGRVIKCLTIVDDATHEAVAVEVERAVSGAGVTRVLDRLAGSRGLPKVLRTDNGKEFCGKSMTISASIRPASLLTGEIRSRRCTRRLEAGVRKGRIKAGAAPRFEAYFWPAAPRSRRTTRNAQGAART